MNGRRLLTLDEIHKYELDMFKTFVNVCEAKKLRYYLAGGTLLGAVRHKGFIPWDDDIDILMPRPDYMKFVRLDHSELFEKYISVSSYEAGNLNYPFCKIFDTRFSIDKEYCYDETEKHLWIDILPLDGLPDSENEIKAVFRKSLIARRMLKISRATLGKGTTRLKTASKYVLKPAVNLIGRKRILKYINRLCFKYDFDKCGKIGGIAMGYGPQEAMPKSKYLPAVNVEFEGLTVNAPMCYDFYLKRLYGDYMQLPPEEKRVAHPMRIFADK